MTPPVTAVRPAAQVFTPTGTVTECGYSLAQWQVGARAPVAYNCATASGAAASGAAAAAPPFTSPPARLQAKGGDPGTVAAPTPSDAAILAAVRAALGM
jgi:hypothetical protein